MGNAFPVFDGEGLRSVVDEEHADFPAVVGVNGARGIQHRDAVLEGEAGPRSDLEFGAYGQCREEPGRDEVLVEAGLVAELADQLARRNTWRVERSGEHIEVRVGDRTLVGRVLGLT